MIKVDYTEVKTVKVASEEQEISITKGRNEDFVEIYCSDNTYLTKILKQIRKYPEGWECYEVSRIGDNPTGYLFKASKKCLTIRSVKPANKRRAMTTEERRAVGERFRKKNIQVEN